MKPFNYPATTIYNAKGVAKVVHSAEEYWDALSEGWLVECPPEFAPPPPQPPPVPAPATITHRVCSVCGQPGHNIRKCPQLGRGN